MFRRRPRRRPIGRRPPIGPRNAALQMLRRAHRLMQTGQYAQAYPLLKRLADGAAQRGMAVRAANLYLQAARARLEMGGVQDAVALARRAIQLLVNVGQVEKVQMLLPKMVQALQEKGCHDEAIALRAEVTAQAGTSSPTPSLPSRGPLPTQSRRGDRSRVSQSR